MATTPAKPAGEELSVRVAVRARPLIPREKVEKSKECLRVYKEANQVVIGKGRSFAFDYVFGTDSTQEQIFNEIALPLLETFFQGYNGTIFAYGQTGSGKTYTMGSGSEADVGIIPRVIEYIFDHIDSEREDIDFMLRISFLEIYNEQVKDLMNPNTPSKDIQIREDLEGNIQVQGVQEEVVTSRDEMLSCLQRGTAFRTTGSTLMNEVSSRSHSILTIFLEKRVPIEGSEESDYVASKFHLVDLAGSERNKRTGASGTRFKESITINCGLLALGNVISALGDEKKRNHVTHVPYRESKLTRLLQDSLGGNSRTVMVACVSPADTSFEETLNTLKYANRARNIKNKPIINRDPQSALLAKLRNEIQILQLELLRHKMVKDVDGNIVVGDIMEGSYSLEDLMTDEKNKQYIDQLKSQVIQSGGSDSELKIIKERSHILEKEIVRLKEELTISNESVEDLSEKIFLLHSERQRYKNKLLQCIEDVKGMKPKLMSLKNAVDEGNAEEVAELVEIATNIMKLEKEIGNQMKEDIDVLVTPQKKENTEKNATSSSPSSPVKSDSVLLKQLEFAENELLRYKEKVQVLEFKLEERSKTIRDSFRNSTAEDRPLSAAVEDEDTAVLDRYRKTIQNLEDELFSSQQQLASKEAEVVELRRDLKRDEEIFAEKYKEVKKLTKKVREHQRERDTLESQLADSRNIIAELEEQLNYKEQGSVAETSETPDNISSSIEKYTFSPAKKIHNQKSTLLKRAEDGDEVQLEENQIFTKESSEGSFELEKSLLEQQVSELEDRFKQTQQELEDTVKELTMKVKYKEQVIRDLVKSENEMQLEKAEYESRIQDMESEIKLAKEKLNAVMKEMGHMGTDKTKKDEEKLKLKNEYETKIRKMKDELQTLRNRQKESERLRRSKVESDRRVKDLETEIEKKRSQQDILRKKIKDESHKYDRIRKKLYSLKKEAESSQKRVRELEMENEKQKEKLKKKSEEISKAKELLKEGSPNPKKRKRSIDQERAWLEAELEKYMKKKEATEVLERELRRREKIVREKEQYLQQKIDLETKKLRQSEISLREQASIRQSREEYISEHQDEEADLLAESNEEESGGPVFEDESKLRELDERIEILDAEIEYKNDAIAQVTEELRVSEKNGNETSLLKLKDISLHKAKGLLRKYFEKVVEMKEAERYKDGKLQELEFDIQEKKRRIENLENSIRLTENEYERRIAKTKKEYELNMQYLLKQLNTKHVHKNENGSDNSTISNEKEIHELSEQVQILQKDNFYYRQTNRELKDKLREMRNSRDEAKRECVGLQQELENVKHYLRDHPQIHSVRVSTKELRPLTPEDVEVRRSLAL